ncbi:MAG: hypothetical protein ACLSWS_21840 [Faecalispora jeddahensis]
MTTEELDKLSRLPIKGTDPAELVDLSTVSITGDTPAQRLDSYLTQVKTLSVSGTLPKSHSL